MSFRIAPLATVAALVLAHFPVAAPAVAAEFDPIDLTVGTLDDPARYPLDLDARAGAGLENLDDAVYFRVDIPVGQRLHVGYRIQPEALADDVQVSAELIDADGYLSDFDKVDTINNESAPNALRAGFLVSDVMGPENRSYGRETLLRLNPSAPNDGDTVPVELTLSLVPEVVDGGMLEAIERPKLRYAEDLTPVKDEEADQVIEEEVGPGETTYHRVEMGWMEAIDATAEMTNPTSAQEGLHFSLFNRIDEPLAVVGEQLLPASSNEPVTFGQRTPGHYKNVEARNKTRTTGFLDGPVVVGVTNSSDEKVGYRLKVAARGEGVPADSDYPLYDAVAAEQAQEELGVVDHEYHLAAGMEESTVSQLLRNPLTWIAGGLLVAALILAGMAGYRRR